MKSPFVLLATAALLVSCADHPAGTVAGEPQDRPSSAASGVQAPGLAPMAAASRGPAAGLASAPDHGALFSYATASAPRVEGAYTLHPVRLSEAHALNAVARGEMIVPLPDGTEATIRYERHVEHPDGNWTWIGRVEGGQAGQQAVLTFGEEAVYGAIPQSGGRPSLNVSTRGGTAYLAEPDPSMLRHARRGSGNDVMTPPAAEPGAASEAAVVALAKAQARVAAEAAPPMAAAGSTPSNTIDLVVGYTNGFRAARGSQSGAVTRLHNLVDTANQALVNSQVAASIRLVGAIEVAYPDDTDNGEALEEVTGYRSNGGSFTPPAALQPLRAARDEHGADVVVLLRRFRTPENDGCGIAWLLGANGTAINASDAPFAYSVVSDGDDVGSDGKTYFCDTTSLGHEIAHNLGSAHDVANAGGTPGRYPYSYGYQTGAGQGNFFTVMAYGSDGQEPILVFSNPQLNNATFCNSRPCGVANQTDNARSLRQTVPVVATFRATVVPHAQRLNNDFNADGRSDVFWRNTGDGRNIVWWAGNYGTQVDAGAVSTLAWNVAGAGDFDGDGSSDLFWRNRVTGENIVWPAGNTNQKRYVTSVVTQAWQVAGVGDFDGDGKADIFWRNASNGGNIIWWSGSYAALTTEHSVPVAWKVAGIGDFDGDGKSDVFWRNTSDGRSIVWWSGKYAGHVERERVADQNWEVVAAGDFNGDGKADLFWRNRASGENLIWWDGRYKTRENETTVAVAWKVVASGDYDGDGEIDLFWRNSTNGANIIWDSGRYANRRDVTSVPSTAWTVQQ